MEIYTMGAALAGRSGHDMGRELLQKLYAAQVGGPMPEILAAPGGKPYFADGPWHFSITHTKNHAFAALCRVPVGIDAEELTRPVSPALAQRILSPAEKAQYDRARDKNRALLTFWVQKEAAAKASGRGVHYPENHTAFALDDPHVWEEQGCLVAVCAQEDSHDL